jgi:hypothetical protein
MHQVKRQSKNIMQNWVVNVIGLQRLRQLPRVLPVIDCKVEKANTKRVENKQLEDEHIQWLEEHLALLSEEFSRRTGLPLPSKD